MGVSPPLWVRPPQIMLIGSGCSAHNRRVRPNPNDVYIPGKRVSPARDPRGIDVDTRSQVPPFPLVPEFVNIESSAVKCV